MITFEVLLTELPGLPEADVRRWIANEWVRPDKGSDSYVFRDIDVARIRLIRDLRDELEINEAALPVVLMLLDQLYDLRRRLRELSVGSDEPIAL